MITQKGKSKEMGDGNSVIQDKKIHALPNESPNGHKEVKIE